MRFSIVASMLVALALASAAVEAARECDNYSPGCKACVCHVWSDTSKCCTTEFNGGNGNCEGIKTANTGRFQACCNGKSGFSRCW
ncbi:hypothetical protein BGW38_006689 [Lunasporangiospora selenospora]|uniref:Uncharacterized protein n=1 Tax=Lunasporangiospora selenospora TaxID=979761 RepID=A0A9P6G0Z4_9FUNG|nr:hypothetical protein BGW38_006689 [Lunasporangiospora selenospora]